MACGSVVAYVYALLLVHVPLAGYVTILFAVGFGYCVGTATARGLRLGKVRHRAASVLVVAVVALLSIYLSWAAWVHVLLANSGVGISLGDALSPDVLWRVVSKINERGL